MLIDLIRVTSSEYVAVFSLLAQPMRNSFASAFAASHCRLPNPQRLGSGRMRAQRLLAVEKPDPNSKASRFRILKIFGFRAATRPQSARMRGGGRRYPRRLVANRIR